MNFYFRWLNNSDSCPVCNRIEMLESSIHFIQIERIKEN
jgi:hypothetical protein